MVEIIHPCDEVFHPGIVFDAGPELLFCHSGEAFLRLPKDPMHGGLFLTFSRPGASWVRLDAEDPQVHLWAEQEGFLLKGGGGVFRKTEKFARRIKNFPWDLRAREGIAILHALAVVLPARPEVVGIWREAKGNEPQAVIPRDRLDLFEVYRASDKATRFGPDMRRIPAPDLSVAETLEDGPLKMHYPVNVDEAFRLFCRIAEDDEGRATWLVSTPSPTAVEAYRTGKAALSDMISTSPVFASRENFDGTALLRSVSESEAESLLRFFEKFARGEA